MCTSTSMPSSGGLWRRIAVVTTAFSLLLFLILLLHTGKKININGFQMKRLISSAINDVLPSPHWKLLAPSVEPTRFWDDTNKCSESDLSVGQIPSAPLPSGIPTYTVEIVNVCSSGCDIAHIHLRCGWFSSAFPVDPSLFRRIRFDDCVVNAGRILGNGESFTFQYANTYSYPLSISSMSCL
ncbi:TPD1 protein homolog 1-like [Chenopodium quinoa]|uniref:TPD1 protein homolog 1-like n=1 Tax=Chenopodium quinoa TaxID=63459 RepID=UPI000B770FC7|nr:TPD1 protein homolog 1-like [Chenopodium quinoa]